MKSTFLLKKSPHFELNEADTPSITIRYGSVSITQNMTISEVGDFLEKVKAAMEDLGTRVDTSECVYAVIKKRD